MNSKFNLFVFELIFVAIAILIGIFIADGAPTAFKHMIEFIGGWKIGEIAIHLAKRFSTWLDNAW